MPRRSADREEWEADDWDDEDDGPYDDEDDVTVPCPYCQREIYDDSEHCPFCGKYLSSEDRPATPKPWWIIIGVLLCFLVIYRWIFW